MRKAVMTLALANLGRPLKNDASSPDGTGRRLVLQQPLGDGGSTTLVSRQPAPAARPRARSPETRRFGRFLVVGLGGTLIDFGLLALLTGIGVPTLLANTLSFSAGACSNFTWNRLWTFREARRRPWGVQLVQFLAVSAVGLVINDAIVMMLQTPLGSLLEHPAQGYLPAKVVATGVAVAWNFLANRYWTFGEVEGHAV